MSRYCCFWFQWQDIRIKVLAEMKWKNSHKFCMLWEMQQDICHVKKLLLVVSAVSTNSKKIGLWPIITMEKTFSCKDCNKMFVLSRYCFFWFQWQDIPIKVLAEIKWKNSHKLCMLWEMQQDVCHVKKLLLVVPAVSMNKKNWPMKNYSLWKNIFM